MISSLDTEHPGASGTGGTETPRLDAGQLARVTRILERHGRRACRLVPILQEVQAECRYLPAEVLSFVARALNVAPARVFGVATFYAHFAIKPKGRHLVRLCDGTACHVKDSMPILAALRQRLGLAGEEATSRDLQFTLEKVACLGACSLAPVVVIDEQVHGGMTPAKAVAAVDGVAGVVKEGAS